MILKSLSKNRRAFQRQQNYALPKRHYDGWIAWACRGRKRDPDCERQYVCEMNDAGHDLSRDSTRLAVFRRG